MTIPQIGELAPDFTLQDQNNQHVTLSEFRGHRPVLLVFYPLAFSGICSDELCWLRDDLPRLRERLDEPALLTVSVDSLFVHRVWADQQNFQFPLLSDFWPHGEVARRFGVFDEVKGVANRATFAIDQSGVVRWQSVNDIGVARDEALYSQALTAVA